MQWRGSAVDGGPPCCGAAAGRQDGASSIYQRFFLPPAGDRQKLPWERMRPPAGGWQNI